MLNFNEKSLYPIKEYNQCHHTHQLLTLTLSVIEVSYLQVLIWQILTLTRSVIEVSYLQV